ncbi:MAG: protease modulator HflK [Planctomycetota bacterium]|jgi:membrane protease subunit HflK
MKTTRDSSPDLDSSTDNAPALDASSDRQPQTRTFRIVAIGVAAMLWLSTGFFVVRGDESAVVRVFGRAERNENGSVVLRPNGVYWHLPWPCSTVDRVRLSEVRTVSLGSAEAETTEQSDLLGLMEPARQSRYLTGDRNILQVQLNVQYRVSAEEVDDWLYTAGNVEERLRMLAEAALADVVLQSGVDFVHTLGHAGIRKAILDRLKALADTGHLGITLEDVTIAGVAPPVRVKAHFVDVMNARADRETYINRARAYSEQKLADAGAASHKVLDEAASYRQTSVDLARAEADSFNRLVDQLQATAESLSLNYAEVRQLALQRQRLDTLQAVYPRLKTRVVLDAAQPIDLTIHRNPAGE